MKTFEGHFKAQLHKDNSYYYLQRLCIVKSKSTAKESYLYIRYRLEKKKNNLRMFKDLQ